MWGLLALPVIVAGGLLYKALKARKQQEPAISITLPALPSNIIPPAILADRLGISPCFNIGWSTFASPDETIYSSYLGRVIDGIHELGCALPYTWVNYQYYGRKPPFNVRVTNPSNRMSIVVPILDSGPHRTNDPYWKTPDGRPIAESKDKNGAGIDLTPYAALAIGFKLDRLYHGLGRCHWEFTQYGVVGDIANIDTIRFDYV